ncbi:MAG: UPF0104 family protein [Bradymonadales bacterium]|nr:MAG: UPF0104 family protein [Bradymonadales bacterium]
MQTSNKIWVGLGLSAALLLSAFYFLDVQKVIEELRSTTARLLWICFGLAFLQQIALAIRWQRLLQPLGLRGFGLAFWSLRLNYFYNLCLPARLGEPYRIYFLHRRAGLKAATLVGTMAAERFLDLLGLIFFVYLSFLVLGLKDQFSLWKWFLLLGAGLSLVMIFIRWTPRHKGGRWIRKLIFWRDQLLKGMKVLMRPKVFLAGILTTAASWLIFSLMIFLILKDFDVSASFFHAILVLAGVSIAVALPSSPGQIGTFEAGAALALVSFLSVNLERAVSIGIIFHLSQMIPTLVVGLIGFVLYQAKAEPKVERSKPSSRLEKEAG